MRCAISTNQGAVIAKNKMLPLRICRRFQIFQSQAVMEYTANTMPGMATPIMPFESVANAMKAQQAHIQFRLWVLLEEVCANKRLQRAATKKAESPMSNELIWPPMTHIGLDAKATAASQPARAL